MGNTAVGDFPNDRKVAARLPMSARIGRVRLAVSELELSIRFYTRVIGLVLIDRGKSNDGPFARLGVDGRVLLELQELAGVDSIGQRSRLGLYHTAFLLPTREDLGAFVEHLRKLGLRFGAGDHLVSEAIYLADPDGLQVEVYADRPRSGWSYAGGEVLMQRSRCDLRTCRRLGRGLVLPRGRLWDMCICMWAT